MLLGNGCQMNGARQHVAASDAVDEKNVLVMTENSGLPKIISADAQ
jgi:hypothetical protein